MPTTVPITHGWTLELDAGFERRVEEGDLVVWDGRRTVYASVFEAGNAEAEEAIAAMLEGRKATPVRTFDRVAAGLAGHAYLLPEGGAAAAATTEDDDDENAARDGRPSYWGLNTWTAARGSLACVTFYFPQLDDLPWAVRAWESIRCDVCVPRYVN